MRKHPRLRVVIVDGYSTGRELVRELLDREVECLHLQSTREMPGVVVNCFDVRPYDRDLGYLGSVASAAAALQSLKPDLILAGSEWGVIFAEKLAARMGLPTNQPETVQARRDKFEMVEAARRHGLNVAEQAMVETLPDALAWADQHGKWPIVMKPLDSAGSDGVSICRSKADIAAAFSRDFGRCNFMGGLNSELLMQSYLPGTQFIVNTVSWGGRHHVTDIWRMTVSAGGNCVVPGGIHLCDPETTQAEALAAYAFDVLDALGIENGPAHTELKWTPAGPALIETGARLMGAVMDAPAYTAAALRTQADVFADVIAGCEAVFARPIFQMGRHISVVLFNFSRDGVIRSTAGLERLCRLPTFHSHCRALSSGDRVWRTADWLTCGGVIYLVHDDPVQIRADIETIRLWEQVGALYDVDCELELAS